MKQQDITHEERVKRHGGWLQTFTGKAFFFRDPQPDDICIEDIAHALSNYCRYSGHCREFYSVAQHSVLVSELLPRHLKLAGLLHDATEAYLGDVTRPLKHMLPEYMELEANLHQVISDKFGVSFNHPAIKEADNVALMTEARDLFGYTPADWGNPAKPIDVLVIPLTPPAAANLFMFEFIRLQDPKFADYTGYAHRV